jgi:hypothetical protein
MAKSKSFKKKVGRKIRKRFKKSINKIRGGSATNSEKTCKHCSQRKYCKNFPNGKTGTHQFSNGKCNHCPAKGPACSKFPKGKTGNHIYE